MSAPIVVLGCVFKHVACGARSSTAARRHEALSSTLDLTANSQYELVVLKGKIPIGMHVPSTGTLFVQSTTIGDMYVWYQLWYMSIHS
jgi:hypothetical protein